MNSMTGTRLLTVNRLAVNSTKTQPSDANKQCLHGRLDGNVVQCSSYVLLGKWHWQRRECNQVKTGDPDLSPSFLRDLAGVRKDTKFTNSRAALRNYFHSVAFLRD